MNAEIIRLQEVLRQKEEEKAEREKALPAHSIRPHQLLAIEELEEEIARLEAEIKILSQHSDE